MTLPNQGEQRLDKNIAIPYKYGGEYGIMAFVFEDETK